MYRYTLEGVCTFLPTLSFGRDWVSAYSSMPNWPGYCRPVSSVFVIPAKAGIQVYYELDES